MKKILKDYIEFYKKNLRLKHIICSIICILVFTIFLVSNIYEFSHIDNISYEKIGYFSAIKENLLLCFIIIFAGITPYFFLSILGFSAMYNIALKVAILYVSSQNKFLLIGLCIVAAIISIAYSLCIAEGIYYCVLSSKKFSYSQKKGFKFDDFKMSIYKLRKNEEKLKLCEKKKKESMEKAEKLNVKIPYKNFIITFLISIIILSFTSIILK